MEQTPETPKNKKFGVWEVNAKGDMINREDEKKIITLTADRLAEKDLFYFFRTQPDTIWNDFIPAYFQAIETAGTAKEITIKMKIE